MEEEGPISKVLIANVDSGPGTSVDSSYTTGITTAKASVEVIGYVHSQYGSSSVEQVLANITLWNQYYSVKSFFLDETANTADQVGYYTNLTTQIRSAFPNSTLVANMGTMPDVEGIFIFKFTTTGTNP